MNYKKIKTASELLSTTRIYIKPEIAYDKRLLYEKAYVHINNTTMRRRRATQLVSARDYLRRHKLIYSQSIKDSKLLDLMPFVSIVRYGLDKYEEAMRQFRITVGTDPEHLKKSGHVKVVISAEKFVPSKPDEAVASPSKSILKTGTHDDSFNKSDKKLRFSNVAEYLEDDVKEVSLILENDNENLVKGSDDENEGSNNKRLSDIAVLESVVVKKKRKIRMDSDEKQNCKHKKNVVCKFNAKSKVPFRFSLSLPKDKKNRLKTYECSECATIYNHIFELQKHYLFHVQKCEPQVIVYRYDLPEKYNVSLNDDEKYLRKLSKTFEEEIDDVNSTLSTDVKSVDHNGTDDSKAKRTIMNALLENQKALLESDDDSSVESNNENLQIDKGETLTQVQSALNTNLDLLPKNKTSNIINDKSNFNKNGLHIDKVTDNTTMSDQTSDSEEPVVIVSTESPTDINIKENEKQTDISDDTGVLAQNTIDTDNNKEVELDAPDDSVLSTSSTDIEIDEETQTEGMDTVYEIDKADDRNVVVNEFTNDQNGFSSKADEDADNISKQMNEQDDETQESLGSFKLISEADSQDSHHGNANSEFTAMLTEEHIESPDLLQDSLPECFLDESSSSTTDFLNNIVVVDEISSITANNTNTENVQVVERPTDGNTSTVLQESASTSPKSSEVYSDKTLDKRVEKYVFNDTQDLLSCLESTI